MKKQHIQALVHTVCLLPLIIVFGSAVMTLFGFSSTLAFVAGAGLLTDAAMIAFTAMLAVTPLMIFTGWSWPNPLRRPLALYAFAYSMIHFVIFSGGFGFVPVAVAGGAFANAMLTTGTIALLGMVPLALTSNKFSMKLMKRNWKKLHYVTYGVAVFTILHLLFLGTGFGWAALFTVLLGVRIPAVRKTIVQWRKQLLSNKRSRKVAVAQPAS